jgi:hypothetical protein
MTEPKFYDISTIIDPDYKFNGSVSMNYDEFIDKIIEYLNENKHIKYGDILFTGSTYETRQEYGFFLVLENNEVVQAEHIINTIIDNCKKLPKDINYKNLIDDLEKNYEYHYLLFFGGNDSEVNICIDALKNINLFM